MNYDPQYISQYYDAYGEREWTRLEASPSAKVNFYIHRYYLERYIKPGVHVLEAGAGPGRFTIELAKLGAKITVGDISPGQLELNRQKVKEAGCEASVVRREILDITNLSRFADKSFDAVVCYGGPLSYVMERADDAVGELLRVTQPSGYLLLSVMSLLGTTQRYLPSVWELADQFGLSSVQKVINTGDLSGEINKGHICRMYRWAQLQALLERHPCKIRAASAANFLSLHHEEILKHIESDSTKWETFLQWELDFCKESGALDGGTHIIAVVRRD
ncbi:methyltransferase domain-containing protein [Candidatus Acetothermia bacterium]|nr:methyltransferase domain-containing protein [Candidatus Acetothermia bacterium]